MGADPARLFVALELPSVVRGALADWGSEQVGHVAGLRRVRPESLHVTLCFLGSHPMSAVGEIGVACRAAAGLPAPRLAVGDALWLPRRRPRVLAIELADDSAGGDAGGRRLAALQSAVGAALEAGGFYEPETRPFLGHVTVARVPSGTRVAPVALGPPESLRFDATRVTLYCSLLGSGPARYEALETVVLTGAPTEAVTRSTSPAPDRSRSW